MQKMIALIIITSMFAILPLGTVQVGQVHAVEPVTTATFLIAVKTLKNLNTIYKYYKTVTHYFPASTTSKLTITVHNRSVSPFNPVTNSADKARKTIYVYGPKNFYASQTISGANEPISSMIELGKVPSGAYRIRVVWHGLGERNIYPNLYGGLSRTAIVRY